MVIAVSFLTVMLIPLFFKKRRRVTPVQEEDAREEELIRNCIETARSLRSFTRGDEKGITWFYKKIKRCERMISAKVKNDKELTEAEKWIYENFHFIYKSIFEIRYAMKDLPKCGEETRIVVLARKIVVMSLTSLSPERVEKVMAKVSDVLSLEFREVQLFRLALRYALIERIYVLSQRLIFQDKCAEYGKKGKIVQSLFTRDTYLYQLIQNKDILKELERRGVDEKKVRFSFNETMTNNTLSAKTYIMALRSINEYYTVEDGLKNLPAYKIIDEKCELKRYDIRTVTYYFERISAAAKRARVEEGYAGKRLVECSTKSGMDISVILTDYFIEFVDALKGKEVEFKKKTNEVKEKAYITCTLLLTVGIIVALFFLHKSIVIACLSFIPVFFFVDKIVFALFSLRVKPVEVMKMKFDSLPHSYATAVVISAYCCCEEELNKAIFHARSILAVNRDKYIGCVILVDTPPADSPVSELDKKLVDTFNSSEKDDRIQLFIRKKTFDGKKYSAWERKRGAILTLCKYYVERTEDNFYFVSGRLPFDPVLFVALDTDNRILPQGIKDMAERMAHPYNQKYDLLSAKNRIDLYSLKTMYSLRFLPEAGYECYPFFAGNFAGVFGKEIFCGKGIFRIKEFYNKLSGLFPEKKILSHDIPEGACVSTGYGGVTFEDAPNTFLEDASRNLRWLRGDIQNLPFIFGRWRAPSGEKVKRNFSPIYRFVMLKNVVAVLFAPCVLSLFLLGLCYDISALPFGLGLYFLPYIYDVVSSVRGITRRVRLTHIVNDVIHLTFSFCEGFFMLLYKSVLNLTAFFITTIKMLFGGDLMKWKTFSQSKNRADTIKYVAEFIPSIVFGCLICLTAFLFGKYLLLYYFSAYFLCALLCYFILYLSSTASNTSPSLLTKESKEKLLSYAQATYAYFRHVYSDVLPGDNLQVEPYKGIAPYTSSTDIGFALLAEICAQKLNLSTYEESAEKVRKLLYNVEKLPKWNGLLYNWYFVESGKPTGGFVSSVDEGNFLLALLIVRSFYKGKESRIVESVDRILSQTDLKKLFDRNKNQFYIGYDGGYVGHYDILESEARIISLVYIMLGGDIGHYHALSRDYARDKNGSLLSWGGTAFECLMPELFFGTPEYSVLDNTAQYNVIKQLSTKRRGLFGASESGYYSFDEEMRYQYKSFGLNQLSVSTDTENNVISPYSSFLCLRYAPEKVLNNLALEERKGLFSEYGFFESIDFTNGSHPVRQYMTHHQGMILCSIVNFLSGDFLPKLLYSIPAAEGVKTLFNERAFSERIVLPKRRERKVRKVKEKSISFSTSDVEKRMISVPLYDGSFTVICNTNGGNFSSCEGVYLQKKSEEYTEPTGAFFYVEKEGKMAAPTFLPLGCNDCSYDFSYTDKEVICRNLTEKIEQKTTLLSGFSGYVTELTCEKEYMIRFYSDICLNTMPAYLSHPVFSDMFVTSKRISDDTVLYSASRGKKMYLGVKVTGVKNLKTESNRMNFIGRGHTVKNPVFSGENGPHFGDILTPCYAFSGQSGGKNTCRVCFIFGYDRDEVLSLASMLPEDMYSFALHGENTFKMLRLYGETLSKVLYAPYATNYLKSALIGDRKKIACLGDDVEEIREYFTLQENLRGMGFSSELVFKSQKNKYFIEKESAKRHVPYSFSEILPEYITECDEERYRLGEYVEDAKTNDCGITYPSGEGGFNEDNVYVCQSTALPKLVYSHVVAGRYGGSVITSGGGGFFWFHNSRENKSVPFDNDPVSDRSKEFLFYRGRNGNYNLLGGSGKARYCVMGRGYYLSSLKAENFSFETIVTAAFDGKVRIIKVKTGDAESLGCELSYRLYPCLGAEWKPYFISISEDDGIIECEQVLRKQKIYLRCFGEGVTFSSVIKAGLCGFELTVSGSYEAYFVFSYDRDLIKSLTKESCDYYAGEFVKKNDEKIKLKTGNRALECITSYLPYQVYSSRLLGRTGFYQVGGAYGFRDQLQDVSSLTFDLETMKEQIILCCKHQYKEGDVMHWWHEPKFGLRSRISDDKLFLPWAVCRYISVSTDTEILNYEVEFLNSEPLYPGEKSRYENPPEGEKDTVFKHCLLAIKSALKYGEHRLLIMGSGDWNDGMDTVCEKGKGESVFNSMFAYMTLSRFAELCPEDLKEELLSIASDLKEAVNKFAFDIDRYIRLFTDEGEALGKKDSPVLELDLLVQAFGVLSGVADPVRVNIVLDTCKGLIDREKGIIKLLYPTLTDKNRLGYISDYPQGVRENGGQYTHAAVWYLIALCKAGRQDEAYELFCMINPAEKCASKEGNERYKGEPYVLSGDVYSHKEYPGRCGWSWYTGSAAWAYRLITEEFFGLKRRGNLLYIEPKLPKKLNESTLFYRYKSSIFEIKYIIGSENKMTVDGVECDYISLKDGVKSLAEVEIAYSGGVSLDLK